MGGWLQVDDYFNHIHAEEPVVHRPYRADQEGRRLEKALARRFEQERITRAKADLREAAQRERRRLQLLELMKNVPCFFCGIKSDIKYYDTFQCYECLVQYSSGRLAFAQVRGLSAWPPDH
jgi:hypothetical protein